MLPNKQSRSDAQNAKTRPWPLSQLAKMHSKGNAKLQSLQQYSKGNSFTKAQHDLKCLINFSLNVNESHC